jgi:hypothetical protein
VFGPINHRRTKRRGNKIIPGEDRGGKGTFLVKENCQQY